MYSPHGCYNSLESREQHSGSQVNSLIGLAAVALRGLACAQEGHECVREWARHDLGDGENIILKNEAAHEGVSRVLSAMARKVDDVGLCEGSENARRCVFFQGTIHLIVAIVQLKYVFLGDDAQYA